MAMAMGDWDCNGNGNGNGNKVGNGNGDGDSDGKATAMARATITKEGLPLHVAVMCSAFGGATPCLHPHGHKQKCMHHGGDTAKSVVSPSRGRVPDSSPWMVFFFLQLLFSLLNNPLFAPPHYLGAQEPCQPIDVQPPPLLQEPRQPIDDLPRLLLHFLSR
jgi:hypothetical protein